MTLAENPAYDDRCVLKCPNRYVPCWTRNKPDTKPSTIFQNSSTILCWIIPRYMSWNYLLRLRPSRWLQWLRWLLEGEEWSVLYLNKPCNSSNAQAAVVHKQRRGTGMHARQPDYGPQTQTIPSTIHTLQETSPAFHASCSLDTLRASQKLILTPVYHWRVNRPTNVSMLWGN